MHAYTLLAPAKINLLLEILGDRTDGFHELVMVLQSVDLADLVELRPLGGERIQIHCDHPEVPTHESNLAFKAARLMQQKFPGRGGVSATIHKQIPVGAGLAGGSTNAAAVLVGLDLMWNLGLTQGELQGLGAALGSDVPFCISGGTALALGRGEVLSPLLDLDQLYVVLAKYRSLAISTSWAYQTYRQQFGHTYPQTPTALEQSRRQGPSVPMVAAINHRDLTQIGSLLYNDLERVVLPQHPQVQKLRDQFLQFEAKGALMSGSGSTVFGLTETRSQAETLAEQMRSVFPDPDLDLWVTKLISSGIQVA
ncbi:4-(cytidine 5'-diphospho)-2-C-methyl-D-erythritol kinase [Synechococcales cyanobacterium C]|uniref:4-diphosphocytidyl-2-C-methyl-D-erythritol kinase n=1 Tax=Petrachloros mirabilis ULC683 TaxID=2781853 RepID=A0A8K1ZXS5_9CYAN|nr:4-(cytidine 5'-diphospho)-2-C-methyl-D-erythritol kinase [Petrachloros mirabilis]NCJ06046.1 4-(cytidine 5'-diphospho)-2-C-methyl-D-erythritol kinase [Petrachloros mirabilis ULC683]